MSDMDPLYESMKDSAEDMSKAAVEMKTMMTADENSDVNIKGYGQKPSFSKQIKNLTKPVMDAVAAWFSSTKVAWDTWFASAKDRFSAFIASSGFDEVGDYHNGPLTITDYNQVIRYNGEAWKLNFSTPIPYTTAGNTDEVWRITDKAKFNFLGEDVLRQNLASPILPGAVLVSLRNGSVADAVNYITPEMFGAVADGVTNNDTAFANINAFVAEYGAAQLNLASGTYLLTQWDIPETLKVIGHGKGLSILACASTATSIDWFIRCCGSTSKQWISELQSFSILGKGKAKYALLTTSTFTTAAVSKGAFRSLELKGGTVAPLCLDATQNSHFEDLNIVGTDSGGLGSTYGIAVLNGAANNTIISAEIAAGIVGIYLGRDTSMGGASVSGLQNYPNGNIFIKAIIEKVTDATYTRTKAIHIVGGNKNKFDTIEMLVGSECAIHVEAGNYNKFYDCTPGSNSAVSIPVAINGGYGTLFANCSSENINGASSTYHVQTSNVVLLLNNRAGGLAKWRVQNNAGNTANNIRHLDPMAYSSNAVNAPPTQLDSGLMAVNSGSQLFVGTPAGVKQVPFYTQRNVGTSLMTYTAGTETNTLSLNYQLTDGYASEITIVVRGNTDRSHRAVIRINAEFTSATVAWRAAQIISAVYNDAFLSNATVSVSASGMLTLSLTTNPTITEGDYRLDERILINIT